MNTQIGPIILIMNITLLCILSSCDPQTKAPTQVQKSAVAPVIDADYIATKTVYFDLRGDSLMGEGARVWDKIIAESQFIVLGENHGSARTSELVNALIPKMSNSGFRNFAIEVGPHSAKMLSRLSSPSSETMDQLTAFSDKYYMSHLEGEPIPFFTGKEDARFLQTAAEHQMQLWGLDQEYYYAPIFLMDVLLQSAKESDDFTELAEKNTLAKGAFMTWFDRELEDESFEIYDSIILDKTIMDYLNAIDRDEYTSSIIADLKISWDIYARWRRGSHDDRISYIRNNFLSNYESLTVQEEQPKVFLKFGGLHAAQNLSYGTFDIGYLVNEIAHQNNTISTNISSWVRYYKEDEVIEDQLVTKPSWFLRFEDFIAQGKKDEWALVDLKEIRLCSYPEMVPIIN